MGLLALMLLHHARRTARTGPDGRLVPLAEQDRSLWNTRLIAEGVEVLQAALARDAREMVETCDAVAFVTRCFLDDDVTHVDGKVDRVDILYNGYVSPLVQEVRRETLLPLQQADILGGGEDDQDDDDGHGRALWIYEPDPETILAKLLPRYLEFSIFRMLLESAAAEHGARMTAMGAATKNAGDMIDSLTLTYNRARQARITKELIEIVSGASALE